MGCGASKKSDQYAAPENKETAPETKAPETKAPETKEPPAAPTAEPEPDAERVDAAAMALAESLLTDEGVKQLKELFGTLDKDSDGKVDKKEWGHKVKQNEEAMKKFFGGASLAEIGSAFKTIDADGDGSLTWDEFLGAATKKNKAANAALEHLKGAIATEEGMAELKALFATLDKDGDGKISSKEWGSKVTANQEVMAKFFGGATKAEIGAAFKRIDADGNGFLSFDEFVGAAK